MASIRVRQGGGLHYTATTSNEGLAAFRTAQETQYRYLISAYVDRHYASTGKTLPAATKQSIRQMASLARYNASRRGDTGLPYWERGTVFVAPQNWHKVIGGILIQIRGRKMTDSAFPCYVPLLMEKGLDSLDENRPLYLYG